VLNQEERLKLVEEERIRNSVRNPSVATLLSFFVMGLGQLYNGHINKGILLIFSNIFSLLCGYYLFIKEELRTLLAGNDILYYIFLSCFLILYLIVYIFNLKDAYISAKLSGYIDSNFVPKLVNINGTNYLQIEYYEYSADIVPGTIVDTEQKIIYAWKKIIVAFLFIGLIGVLAGIYFGKIFIKSESELEKSIKFLEQKLKNTAAKNNPEIYFNLAKLYLKQNKNQEALLAIKKAISLKPDVPSFHMILAMIYKELGMQEKGNLELRKAILLSSGDKANENVPATMISDWLRAIKINPNNSYAFFKLGEEYFKQKKFIEAEYSFKKAAKLKPDYIESYTYLVKIAEKLKDYDKAESYLRSILSFQPDNVEALKTFANFQYIQKKYASAVHTLKKILKYTSKDLFILLRLGECYRKINQPDNAIKIYKEILELDNRNLIALDSLIEIYEQQKKFDALENVLLQKISFFKEDLKSFIKLSDLLLQKGNTFMAIKYLKKATAFAPQDKRVLKRLALAYKATGQTENERMILEFLIKQGVSDLNIFERLRNLYEVDGKIKKAVKILNKELNITPNDIKRLNLLATYYFKQNELKEAEKCYQRILTINPEDLNALNKLYIISKKLKHNIEAISFLKKMQNLKPHDVDVLVKLSKLYKDSSLYQQYIETSKKLYFLLEEKEDKKKILDELLLFASSNKKDNLLLWCLKERNTLFPEDIQTLINLAEYYKKHAFFKDEIGVLEKVLILRPDDISIMLRLIDLYEKVGDNKNLEYVLERYCFYRAMDIEYNMKLYHLYKKRHRVKKQKELLEKLKLQFPDNITVLKELYRIYKFSHNSEKLYNILYKLQNISDNLKFLIEFADLAVKKGDKLSAQLALEKSLKQNPNNVEIIKRLIPLYLETNKIDRVIAIYLNRIQENENDKDAVKSLALLYERKEDYSNALSMWEKYLRLSKNSVEALGKLRDISLKLFDKQKVKRYAIKLDRYLKGKEKINNLKILVKVLNADEKEKVLREIVEISPQDEEALNELFKIYKKSSDISGQKYLLNIKLKVNPKDAEAYFERGRLSFLLGKFKEVLRDLKKALKFNYNKPQIYLLLAKTYFAINQEGKAIDLLKKYSAFVEDNPEAYILMAEIYKNRQALNLALASVDKALNISKNNYKAYKLKGIIFKRLRNFEKAIENYNQAINLNPLDSETYYYKAFVLKLTNKFKDAALNCIKALALKPDYKEPANTLKNLFTYFIKKKDSNNILILLKESFGLKLREKLFNLLIEKIKDEEFTFRILKRLSKYFEDDSKLNNLLGNFYYNKGNYNTAINYFKKVIEKENKNFSVMVKLAIAYQNIGDKLAAKKLLNKIINECPEKRIVELTKSLLK